jgi:hypothetical protein
MYPTHDDPDAFDNFASPSDACREYARNVGRDRPDTAWISTPYDTWEPNPFYRGPAQPHPETFDVDEYIVDHDGTTYATYREAVSVVRSRASVELTTWVVERAGDAWRIRRTTGRRYS